MPFNFKKLAIPEVILVEPEVFYDERGFFMEAYKYPDFSQVMIKEPFVQDSHSCSIRKGIIRGLHYQKNPMAQARLVRVVSGEIFDVVVDIRKGSPYYGKWISTILSFENKKMLYIPEGFAHGFCTLSEQVNIIYKFTKVYSRQHYTGIVWNDPVIGIDWPIKSPVLSERDCAYPVLDKADNNFIYACV